MNTIKTWIARCHADGESATDAMQAEITELRERVAYLESYTESQKDAMRVTMYELATVREALKVAQHDLFVKRELLFGAETERDALLVDRDQWKHEAMHGGHSDMLRAERDALQAELEDTKAERDILQGKLTMSQAKLSAMEKQEPVGEGFFNAQGKMCSAVSVFGYLGITEQEAASGCTIRNIYCTPVAPAQPVNELVEAVERILNMGVLAPWNAQAGYFFPVNIIKLVEKALANAKAAQPLTKAPDEDIEYWRKKYQALDKLYDELEKEKDAIEQNLRDRT